MTDEFNLVPTNNLEKHLDNILRAASGEEPQYDLAPNWRVEQYLDAIQKAIAEGGGGSGGWELVEIKTDTSYASATCSHTKEQLDAIREAKGIVYAVITVQDGKGFFSHLPAMFLPNYTGSGYEYNISAVRWSSSNMSDFKLRKIVANVSTLGNVTISKANQT